MRCRFDVGRQPRVTYSEAKTLQKRKTIATIAETQDRTGDLEIFSLTLSQLSYRGFRNSCPLQNTSAREPIRGRQTTACEKEVVDIIPAKWRSG